MQQVEIFLSQRPIHQFTPVQPYAPELLETEEQRHSLYNDWKELRVSVWNLKEALARLEVILRRKVFSFYEASSDYL